mmetsp:Transcript_34177/g.72818  ORF Transcript_34177/g.72818 Transcript_34177/m.72818 type:complete len:710 (+) Transcript_34177:58-2187(+)
MEQSAAALDASGDVGMKQNKMDVMPEPVRKSQRTRVPNVKYAQDKDDDLPTMLPPSKSTFPSSSKPPPSTFAAPSHTSLAPPKLIPPKTPQELHDQIKKSRDKLFFIAYSHNKDPLITEKPKTKGNKSEYQWYLVRVDLTTCQQLEDTQNCRQTGKYYVEFYTKSSYDRGVLLPGNPLENGVPAAKMKPRPDSDSRYWLEWHEYHFDKKNGDMVVGKAKEFLPNSKKAIHRRLMDLVQRTKKRQRQAGGASSPGSADSSGSEGEERLMSEYHPDFDKYTTWADVLDLMDTKTRLVGPFDFDDVKPPPLREEDLAIFNEETMKLFSANHSNLHVKDRVHVARWQELLDAIRAGEREIDTPTILRQGGGRKKKKRLSAGSKRPREEPLGKKLPGSDKKAREEKPPKNKGPVCQDCGSGATVKEPLLSFPATSSLPLLHVRASCRKENSDRMVLSKDQIKEEILKVVDATLRGTRCATSSEYGQSFYVLGEVKEALGQALGSWMALSGVGVVKVSSSVLTESSEMIHAGLPEERFDEEEIETFPVTFAYNHNDLGGGISEENAKIATLDYEVEQRRQKAARSTGGGKPKSSKGVLSKEEKRNDEKSTGAGTVGSKSKSSATPRNKGSSISSGSSPLSEKEANIPAKPAEGFPPGWAMRKIRRPGKGNKGIDTFYYSPKQQFKFRSKLDVRRFLEVLERVGGEETVAIDTYKN